jgi:predicted RNA binding protein YcfA (HicA-like mRNA interferase family)
MPRRKRLTGKELIRALKKAGFGVIRVQGSHHRLRHADGRVTTVPVRRSVRDFSARFSTIATSRTINSKPFCNPRRPAAKLDQLDRLTAGSPWNPSRLPRAKA